MKLMYKKVPARLQELPFHFIIIFDFFYTMCQVSPGKHLDFSLCHPNL